MVILRWTLESRDMFKTLIGLGLFLVLAAVLLGTTTVLPKFEPLFEDGDSLLPDAFYVLSTLTFWDKLITCLIGVLSWAGLLAILAGIVSKLRQDCS